MSSSTDPLATDGPVDPGDVEPSLEYLAPTLDGQPLTAEDADLLARDEAYRARAESLDIFDDDENPPWEM